MDTRTLARMATGALRWRLAGRRAPLNVMIALTNRCNARCGYCDIPNRPGGDPTTAQLLRLIDEAADQGAVRVGFWGGEPLLRTDLADLIGRCKDRGLWTTLDTNAWLLHRRVAALRRVDHVVISFDGRPERHDLNRGEGSAARTLRGMKAAADAGIPFWTLTVLTRHNLGDVGYVLDLAEQHGAKAAFQVLHHPPELSGGRGDDLLPSNAAYRRVLARLMAEKAAGRPVANSEASLRALHAWPDFARPTSAEPHRGRRCVAGDLYANVDVDGGVYPCSLLVGRVPAKSAFEDGFRAAFDGVAEPDCRSCTATAFDEYDRLFGLDVGAAIGWARALRPHRSSRRAA